MTKIWMKCASWDIKRAYFYQKEIFFFFIIDKKMICYKFEKINKIKMIKNMASKYYTF